MESEYTSLGGEGGRSQKEHVGTYRKWSTEVYGYAVFYVLQFQFQHSNIIQAMNTPSAVVVFPVDSIVIGLQQQRRR